MKTPKMPKSDVFVVNIFYGVHYLIFSLVVFLGRLPKVDLIILEGEKCPYVRTSVRPQKVSSI